MGIRSRNRAGYCPTGSPRTGNDDDNNNDEHPPANNHHDAAAHDNDDRDSRSYDHVGTDNDSYLIPKGNHHDDSNGRPYHHVFPADNGSCDDNRGRSCRPAVNSAGRDRSVAPFR